MKNTVFSVLATALFSVLCLSSCSKDDFKFADGAFPEYGGEPASKDDWSTGGISGGDNGQGPQSYSGVLTAGEWSDLDNWDFWCSLMNGQVYNTIPSYWGFNPDNRVSVKLTDDGNGPVAGVKVALKRDGAEGESTIWKTVSDNHGLAECWLGMYRDRDSVQTEGLFLEIDGVRMDSTVKVTTLQDKQGAIVNTFTVKRVTGTESGIQIAFIVDATGSMSDEIAFLKSDLDDIIFKAGQSVSGKISTAALFYRDEGDDYITRSSNFSDDLDITRDFIREQSANGGGDYPEALHTALEKSLQELSWNERALSRVAFLILDAPAHYNQKVIDSIRQSVNIFAQSGIKLVPVASSGVDKNTEFLCRSFALATCGTYVFLTDDSGVGGDHIEASVGKYDVELLNELIVRLIKYYAE